MALLIDGHNLIGQMPDIALDDPDDELKLVQRLRIYRAQTGKSITVVFDSGGTYHPPQNLSGGGVEVVFAPVGSNADAIIARRIRRSRNPPGLTVVSSDREVRAVANECGARMMGAAEFCAELAQPKRRSPRPRQRRLRPEPKPSAAEIEEWLAIFRGDRPAGEQ